MKRPDINFAISTLSKRNSKACARHWDAELRIIRYLVFASNISYRISAGKPNLVIWVDASYGADYEQAVARLEWLHV
jgi:hypothetical protein